MPLRAPPIDKRTPADVALQARQLLCHYLQGPPYGWRAGDDGGEAGRALVGVFAHYCGLVIDRINRAPDKNFLAFLDLLGNVLIPPLPARAPLTFSLDDAATDGCAIRAGSQVQAETGAGEPLVFETERDLWVSNFELVAMARAPIAGEQEHDVTPLILHPARKRDRLAEPERIFDQIETFYFGLHLAAGRPLVVQRPVTMYFFIDNALYDPSVRGADPAVKARVVWEYSAGPGAATWATLVVEDGTQALTQAGTLEFLVPDDLAATQRGLFEEKLYWIRARMVDAPQGIYTPAPRLYGVALNTVTAQNAVTVFNEVLGGSDGNAGQLFTAFRKPVLPGQVLEVLELRAATVAPGSSERETWVAWTEVSDFYRSGPRDRHYVVNRQTGELRFGDGLRGMIPPPGVRNVRLGSYRTGGGRVGNVPAGALKTLVAANRLIDKLGNLVAAQGGADNEATESLLERAPRALRHRGRAVTDEDYEDLAKLASSDVARALCVPLIDLAQTPSKVIATLDDEIAGAGKLSVIVVPRSAAEKPLPSQVLLGDVEDYLRQSCPAAASLAVVGPLYLRVGITVDVVLTSLLYEVRVKQQLHALFNSYLHPLTGRGGLGWPFGRQPQASDFHRLLAGVEGIDHVSSLKVETLAQETPFDYSGTEPLQCIEQTGRFLICSGDHQIATTSLV